MNPARLTAIAIVLFCGTMTALLVRSVYWPEESGLSTVASQVPVELFLQRSEGSSLDIWDANKVTGNLFLTPGGMRRRNDGTEGGKVRIDATISLKEPVMGAGLLAIQGSCFFSLNGRVDDLDLTFRLPSTPELVLRILQPAGDRWPSIHLTKGRLTLFQSTGGQTLDDANSFLLNTLISSAGISPEALTSQSDSVPPVVRMGRISAGEESFDGYYISPAGEEAGNFRLYMANTGEILRIETPFSKDSALGLRFLSQSLRPPGTTVPALNYYGAPPAKRP